MSNTPSDKSQTPSSRTLWIAGVVIVLLIFWAAGQYTPAYPRPLPAPQQRAICVVDQYGVCR